jgi:hypothetical protein
LEFLRANGLWRQWVEDCPLTYRSGNVPPKQDILGTLLLSVLAGHKRYAQVTSVGSDSVLPGLLGWNGCVVKTPCGARSSKGKPQSMRVGFCGSFFAIGSKRARQIRRFYR